MPRSDSVHPTGGVGFWELDLDEGRDRPLSTTVAADRLRRAVADVAGHGGGRLRLWVRDTDGEGTVDDVAREQGMRVGRMLFQMRRPLPVDEPFELAVRPFVVGQDEAEWLTVNNRAFAWHPDQREMTLAQLEAKEREPWFDAAGFLLHEVEGRLAGFCWTKVHAEADPPVGEIFVIAVDPAFHQRGLGRKLVLAGLDHLHRQGLRIGMLYTEADNDAAVTLYRKLGFGVHSSDIAYDLEVGPA